MTNPDPVDKDKRDLDKFKKMNETKVPWDERVKEIHKSFPSTASLDWEKAFDADIELAGRILRDIIKLDQAPVGRPGPRPSVDISNSVSRYRQLSGQDYTDAPFHEAVRALDRGVTVRAFAQKTGIERNTAFRLLSGRKEPDIYTLEQVAKAYNKHGSYFVEYRKFYIAYAVCRVIEKYPDASVNLYSKLRDKLGAII